jgi:hypothetical protein
MTAPGWLALVIIAIGGAACAPGAAPPSAPAPGAAPGARVSLEASPAALRTAERVQLTGTELGTMWTFENPPLEYWRERYDFTATPEWLEHVRLASVRYGQICSASFVSPTGLVMTNHHCARQCVEAVSTDTEDFVVLGFQATNRAEEKLCPGLFLDQLEKIDDVTARVQAAVPARATPTEATAAIEAEQKRIEEECAAATERECQVVSLFHGGQYRLYQYKRYSPVKLVFAPELQAGFFGGDPDNFTYPRYALDVAFVRAYEADGRTAAATPHYFSWSPAGAREGDLVFITGNPGSTSRQITVSQVLYEKEYRHPFTIDFLSEQRDFLLWLASVNPSAERRVRDQLFSIENSLKAYSGQNAGLQDSMLMGRKIRWERELRQRVDADPRLRAEYGNLWDRMKEIETEKLRIAARVNINNVDFIGEPEVALAAELVRYIEAMSLPEASRPEQYRGAQLAEVEAALRGQTPTNPEISAHLLAIRLDLARRWLPPDDPFLRLAFQPNETPEAAAERLVRTTRVGDATYRATLMQGGTRALTSADDPLLRLVRQMLETYNRLEPRREELNAEEAVENERLARALFAVYGTQLPPDATFTLRISDGVVAGYPYNGTEAPPKTTYYGMYGRSADFDDREPWRLPPSFERRRGAMDLGQPINFVSTNDITGGNSGSPMIDRQARVVGIAFDGNIEQLPNEFLFRTETGGRTVSVHSVGIMEALRSIYRATALVEELLQGSGRP